MTVFPSHFLDSNETFALPTYNDASENRFLFPRFQVLESDFDPKKGREGWVQVCYSYRREGCFLSEDH